MSQKAQIPLSGWRRHPPPDVGLSFGSTAFLLETINRWINIVFFFLFFLAQAGKKKNSKSSVRATSRSLCRMTAAALALRRDSVTWYVCARSCHRMQVIVSLCRSNGIGNAVRCECRGFLRIAVQWLPPRFSNPSCDTSLTRDDEWFTTWLKCLELSRAVRSHICCRRNAAAAIATGRLQAHVRLPSL